MVLPNDSKIMDAGKIRSFRQVPPAHYTFNIESFSSLLVSNCQRCTTNDFEAGGYTWRMVLYPRGKVEEDGNRHVSLYLSMKETDDVSPDLGVNVIANFLVFDAIHFRYLVVQDATMIDWLFPKMNMEWGVAEFISHDDLFNSSNGFLINDRCIFGVEVFVIKNSGGGESLSFIKKPASRLYTWKIENFSALDKKLYYSEVFTVEGTKWKLLLHPNGHLRASGAHLSLFLIFDDSDQTVCGCDDSGTLETRSKSYASFCLRIKNHTNGNHLNRTGKSWFDPATKSWGFADFMSLSDLKDPSNGYIQNDCLIIEAEFEHVSVVKSFFQKKTGCASTEAFVSSQALLVKHPINCEGFLVFNGLELMITLLKLLSFFLVGNICQFEGSHVQ